MKKKYILCLIISLVTLLYTSCSDDEVVRMSDKKVAFMQEEIAVTRAGGDVIALMEWNQTAWTLEAASEGDIVKRFSVSNGGEVGKNGFGQIVITCNENTTGTEREQIVYLTATNGRDRTQLTLIQAAVDKSYQHCYYVRADVETEGDGSKEAPFKTISMAASKVQAGDTVLVMGGIYVEENAIPANSGTEKAMIVFKPASKADEVIIKHPGIEFTKDGTPVFNLNQRSYIWVEGFTFKSYYYAGFTFEMKEANHCVVFDNHFEDIGNDQIVNNGISLIRLYNASDNVICNNFFKDIYGDGVSMGRISKNNLICDNTFDTFKGKARGWAGEGSSYTTNITLGDEMEYADNLIAFNTSTKGKPFVWFDRNGSDNIVLRNVGHDSDAFVFNESRCVRNLIQENICYNIKNVGYETARYETGYTEDARWVNNVAYKCNSGFYISKAWRNDFRNNISVQCNSYSMEFTDIAQECGPHKFENNMFWVTKNNGDNCVKLGNAKRTAQYFFDRVGEAHGLYEDPLFTNPDNGDFTLQEGSPAKGSGTLNCDRGAFAVYPPTTVGRCEQLSLSEDIMVSFYTPVSQANTAGQHFITLQLSYAAPHAMSVNLKAVAGDARPNTDYDLEQTVNFEPGERSKSVIVNIKKSDAPYDQLLCLRLTDANGVQVGARSLHAIRIVRP